MRKWFYQNRIIHRTMDKEQLGLFKNDRTLGDRLLA